MRCRSTFTSALPRAPTASDSYLVTVLASVPFIKPLVTILIGTVLGAQLCQAGGATGRLQPERDAMSTYVRLPDGVQLAVDVWLPNGSYDTQRTYPTAITFARYWRSTDSDASPPEIVASFNARGFVYVMVDIRGTGASFGAKLAEYSVAETRDIGSVIDWVTRQRWSNGAVVTVGSSYAGTMAELSTVNPPIGLKAVIERSPDYDPYAQLLFPGGLANEAILRPWMAGIRALDTGNITSKAPSWSDYTGLSVRAVDSDLNRTMVSEAIAKHQRENRYPLAHLSFAFREDLREATDLLGAPEEVAAPYRFARAARANPVPTYYLASFADAGTAAGALTRFEGSMGPMQVVIGYWAHGAAANASPYESDKLSKPDPRAMYESMIAFSEGVMTGDRPVGRSITYFTAGENAWKRTSSWPPNGSKAERYYFAGNGRLSLRIAHRESACDPYRTTNESGSGLTSRWNQLAQAHYADRRLADLLLKTYTTDAIAHDMEITGTPILHLKMKSDRPDGALIAYLEDVFPSGEVVMVSEGEIRLINRALSTEQTLAAAPAHTFSKYDAEPMELGRVTAVDLALLPLSVRIKKGHRLRLALAGQDKDVFAAVPGADGAIYEFCRDHGAASSIVLPIIGYESAVEKVFSSPFAE